MVQNSKICFHFLSYSFFVLSENLTELSSKSFSTIEVQTDFESLCSKCKSPVDAKQPKVAKPVAKVAKLEDDEDEDKLVMDIDELDEKSPKKSTATAIKAKRRPMAKEWAPNSFSW